ncbi:1837_t:CDS:1, partial [Acaulospora colombiana]
CLPLTNSSTTPLSLAIKPPLRKFSLDVFGGLPPPPPGKSVGNGKENEPEPEGNPVGRVLVDEISPVEGGTVTEVELSSPPPGKLPPNPE